MKQWSTLKRATTGSVAIVWMLAIKAQPILDINDGPVPGNSIVMAEMLTVPALASGPDVVWDFTAAQSGITAEVQLVLPSAASGGGSFPTATVAALSLGNPTVNFMKLGNGLLQTVGLYNGQSMIYIDPLNTMVYPCTYQTAWTDTYEVGTVQGARTYEADGYGTLICEAGTVENVLKVTSQYTSTDTVVAGIHYTAIMVEDVFWSAAYPWPVATTFWNRLFSDGQLIQEQRVGSVIGVLVSAVNSPEGLASVLISPNPTSDIIRLECAVGMDRLYISDAAGRNVIEVQVHDQRVVELPLSTLNVGNYIVMVLDTYGRRYVRKFHKE